jgi:hypothetical protein
MVDSSPRILWGTSLENVLDIGVFDNVRVFPREREGSAYERDGSGAPVSWREGWDFGLSGEARWIPRDADATTPEPRTAWSGPTGFEEFLKWARGGNQFRYQPDRSLADFYVDGCTLLEPAEAVDPDIEEADGSYRLGLSLVHPTVDLGLIQRGLMFEYAPGASLTAPVAATFARTSAATRRGLPSASMAAGIGASEASGTLRDRHYEGALRTAYLESQRIQLVTQPENFGGWTAGGAPTLTSGQADPFGGTAAYLIDDNDGVVAERVFLGVTFSTDGTKPLACFFRQGSASSITGLIGLWDNSAAAWRHKLNVSWSGGVPTVTTGVGSGSIFPVENWGGGWWRVRFTAAAVVAANANQIFIGSDVASFTGSFYVFGCNAWENGPVTSYQGPSLGTKERDDFTWPFAFAPQAMFVYSKFVELGTALSGATNKGILHIGSPGSVPRVFDINNPSGSAPYRVTHGDSAAGYIEASLGAAPAFADVVELMGILYADGHVQIRQSLNGGAETSSTNAATLALAAAWSAQLLRFNQRDTSSTGWAAYANARIGPLSFGGVTRDTIAKVRAA